jgi:hypothetical protein
MLNEGLAAAGEEAAAMLGETIALLRGSGLFV